MKHQQKIMKPLDQYEIDFDVDLGTWDVDFGTWDIDTSLTEQRIPTRCLKGKQGTHSTNNDIRLKDTPPPTPTK